MSLSIGKTIKKLRKERNLTQEELAELLNVTAQAVSKWENETGMPDISQILPLASVFGVSTDVLFGSVNRNEQEEVQKILSDLHEKCKTLEIDEFEDYKLKTEVLKKYPNNYTLLFSCFVRGCFILCSDLREKLSKVDRKAIYDECMRQSQVIFSYCPDTHLVINTRRELIGLLEMEGEMEKARALIEQLPNSVADISGMMMARFLVGNKDGSESLKAGHRNIYDLLREMQQQSKLLARAYMRCEQYDKAGDVCLRMRDMIKAIYKEETYTPPLHLEQSMYRYLAICSLKKHDEETAIFYLEEMYDYTLGQAEGFQKIRNVKTPLLESYEMDFNYPFYEPKKLLLAELERECFKILADHPRFLQLKEKVSQLSD